MNPQDWREIRRLHADGMPIKAIARHRGISRNTVRRALTLDEPPGPARARASVADASEPEIRALLAEDPAITVAAIAERIGWQRSMTVLKDRVRALRADTAADPAPVTPGADLPAQLTEFVGREDELAAIRQALGGSRLVTLMGAGGVGKTRLAIQAADKVRRAFADGVRWVELGALRDPALLAQTLVDALGIRDRAAGQRPQHLLAEHLRNKQVLLVLDNCEHLLGACADLASALLHAARELRIIATSREALAIPGEHVVPVAPFPDDDSAVTLFTARARDILPGFTLDDGNVALVRRICAQLDGLPLAIELACTRLRVLSLSELADRLGHRLRLLTGGNRAAPERHRSLQATVDWSFELCDAVERRLWTRTSVFAGSFTLAAAEEVCGAGDDIVDGIDGLVSKSLLLREEHQGQVRFRMLETLREYGQAELDDAAAAELRERHHAYYARMIAEVTAEWFGPRQGQWCVGLRLEHTNLRAAFETALEHGDATRLIGAPWFLWAAGFSFAEHRYWLERALGLDREPSADRARALATLGLVAALQGDRDAARRALDEGVAVAETVGDPFAQAYNRHEQGLVAFFGGEFDTSETILLEALDRYRGTEAPLDLVGSLRVHLGLLYIFAGDTHEALRHFEQLRPECEQHGERWMLSYAVYGLGLTALMCGDHDGAARHATESLRMKEPFDDTIGLSLTTELLAWTEAAREQPERAAILLGAAETLWTSVGMQLYGSPHWLEQRTRFDNRARRDLGDTAYEAAFRRGQRMGRDQVIAFALGETRDTGHTAPARPALSRREAEVAALVAEGLTNREIAQKLVISHRTVEGHVEHILDKLGLTRRAQVAQWQTKAGASGDV
ncbi:LuxR C-terminal-related transcriptional regulator [Amycolatopsis thermoflava]|uniref:LuxR C-terminal-related transcriptional regulator n=1 Tax=Amycolatopsis thermoflava TaxID=84480 RepID=UPI00364C37A6